MIGSVSVRRPGGSTVANDGSMLGSITAGSTSVIEGGRLLWEGKTLQTNGHFFGR